MDEKDFELDEELKSKPDDSAQINSDKDIKADSADIKADNEPEKIKSTAREVDLNELELTNNAKPMIGDISFGNLFDDHDDEDKPEVGVDKVDKEPDSDVIIPESQKVRTEISGEADSRPNKNDDIEESDKSSKSNAVPEPPSKNKPSQPYTDDVFDIDDEDEEFRIVNNEPKRKSRRKKKSKPAKVNNSIFGGLIIISVILTASILLAYGGIKMGME